MIISKEARFNISDVGADSCGMSAVVINDQGDSVHLKSYSVWHGIISRCYNPKLLKKSSSYVGCSVCDEWMLFPNFEKWHRDNYRLGYHLDKDILIPGNKVYGPETSRYVPMEINNLVVRTAKSRCHQGVDISYGKFRVQIRKSGKKIHIGVFDTEDEAIAAYIIEKESYVKLMAVKYHKNGYIPEDVYNALMEWKV